VRETIEVRRTGFDELEVIFPESITVDFRDVGRKEVEGVDTSELSVDDRFGCEGGREC